MQSRESSQHTHSIGAYHIGRLYICSLVTGFSAGIVLGGLITIHLSWRYIYWISFPFVAVTLLLIIFTFPETNFPRPPNEASAATEMIPGKGYADEQIESVNRSPTSANSPGKPKYRWLQDLKIFHGSYTEESLIKMALRPILALALPPVLWATCTMGVNLGFFIVLQLSYAIAYSRFYHFLPYQSALCWIAGVLGGLVGILVGGRWSDFVAGVLTRRNNGIREPEMRLPAMVIPFIFGPLSLVLYGAAFQYQWHWMVPTFAIGISKNPPKS